MSAATSGSATAVDGASNGARRGGRTSKTELIEALAAELKRQKTRGAELSAELNHTEDVLNRLHDNLLRLESAYEAQSMRNEQIIANLRRDLEKVRQKLEEASHCDEVEASQYLSLIQAGPPSRHPARPCAPDIQGSFSRETDAAFQSSNPPPLLRPRSPERLKNATPPVSSPARKRAQERLQKLDERLAERERLVSPSPRQRETSTAGRIAEQLGLGSSAAEVRREKTPSARPEEPRGAGELRSGAGGVARSGSRLGKLFPTLGRK